MMAELGRVTLAVLAIAHQAHTERALAERICRACVAGLDVDGASLSLLTASDVRETFVDRRFSCR